MAMPNEQLEKELIDLYEKVAELATIVSGGFEKNGEALQLTAGKVEELQQKQAEMDKYLNTLGAENTDLRERIEKLERLTDPEAGR